MPALEKSKSFEFSGVGTYGMSDRFGEKLTDVSHANRAMERNRQRAESIVERYGGHICESYEEAVNDPYSEAIYLPLPPALHYRWAKQALIAGKHVMVEKPFATNRNDAIELIDIARGKNLAIYENYMFLFHSQLAVISDLISAGTIGAVRLYRISFGYPMKPKSDFRHDKKAGGGAFFDVGSHTIRLASYFLGDTARILYAMLNHEHGFETDLFGSGALINENGLTAQISFGMDNGYKCSLEVWGSKGILSTERIISAPAGYKPTVKIRIGSEEKEITLDSDDTFLKSIEYFALCIRDPHEREKTYRDILFQSELMESFMSIAKRTMN